MKEVTVIAKNEVGSLAAVATALGNVGVNIEAISCYGQNNNAVFRIITADASTAMRTLGKIPGVELKESEVLLVKMINRPGELGKITKKLSGHGVNMESLYIVGRKDDFTEVAIKPAVEHFSKAKELLGMK
jgi:hypothetical protein